MCSGCKGPWHGGFPLGAAGGCGGVVAAAPAAPGPRSPGPPRRPPPATGWRCSNRIPSRSSAERFQCVPVNLCLIKLREPFVVCLVRLRVTHSERLRICCLIVSLTVNFYVAAYLRIFVRVYMCVCVSVFAGWIYKRQEEKSLSSLLLVLMNNVAQHRTMPGLYTMKILYSEPGGD